MKILYDYRPWQSFLGRGVGRYVECLFGTAIALQDYEAYILVHRNGEMPDFDEKYKEKVRFCYINDFDTNKYKEAEFDCFINGSACCLGISAENVLDDMYPMNIMKCCRIKTAILHDFIPLFFQQYIPNELNKIAFSLQYEMLKNLDHVFTNSKFVIAQGIKYLGLEMNKCTCLYGGADIKKFTTKNSLCSYSQTTRKNHIIYVSGEAAQKNNEGFVRAFCSAYKGDLIPRDSRLYIVCKASQEFKDSIKRITEESGCRYGKQVFASGFIPDDEMLEIITSARASVFPSFLEGLGLPILESYVAGTPCWASGVHATKEITFPKCTFNPFDRNSMIQAVQDIYNKPELCEKSLEFGRRLIKELTWENAAKKMIEVIEGTRIL